MPKERRDRSVSRDRCRASPYPCSSGNKRWLAKDPVELEENVKEWEEARCPVCMEHPHNAVLLICSSHDNGCRPYMCDTSYRHSNCLDQFRKSFASEASSPEVPPEEPVQSSDLTSAPEEEAVAATVEAAGEEEPPGSCENETPARILCPLCRGEIKEWMVDEPARRFMNAKSRSCSCETCSFSGSYADLRKHARLEHPTARPSEADPARERSWRRLERQRDLGDLLSTLQSSMGDESADEETSLPIDDGRWLTVFFLIRVFRSPGSATRSSSWSGPSRARAQLSIRRTSRLWGESFEDETGFSSRQEDNESSDDGSARPTGTWRRSERIRRRTTPDNNQP